MNSASGYTPMSPEEIAIVILSKLAAVDSTAPAVSEIVWSRNGSA